MNKNNPQFNLKIDYYILTKVIIYSSDMDRKKIAVRLLSMSYSHDNYLLKNGCNPDLERTNMYKYLETRTPVFTIIEDERLTYNFIRHHPKEKLLAIMKDDIHSEIEGGEHSFTPFEILVCNFYAIVHTGEKIMIHHTREVTNPNYEFDYDVSMTEILLQTDFKYTIPEKINLVDWYNRDPYFLTTIIDLSSIDILIKSS